MVASVSSTRHFHDYIPNGEVILREHAIIRRVIVLFHLEFGVQKEFAILLPKKVILGVIKHGRVDIGEATEYGEWRVLGEFAKSL